MIDNPRSAVPKVAQGLSPRAVLIGLLQFAVSVLLVVWAFRHVDLKGAVALIRQGNYPLVVLALAISLFQVGLASWRWRLVNLAIGHDATAGWHFRVFMISLFFGQVLPSTVGGDAYRLWAMTRAGQSYGMGMLSVLCDRVIGVLTIVILSGFVLPFLYLRVGAGDAFWSLSLLVAVGLGGFIFALAVGALASRRPVDGLGEKLAGRVLGAVLAPATALLRIVGNRRKFMLQILMGLGVHLSSVLIMVAVARALNIDFSPIQALAVVPPVILLASLPISIAGWGVREGAMIAGFAIIGLGAGDAVLVSVTFGLVNLVTGLAGAVVWVVFHGRGMAKIN